MKSSAVTSQIGDKVAELAPETSIFFSYLSKLGKKSTDETVWRPLEYRNQWQRRNFKLAASWAISTDGNGQITDAEADDLTLDCGYDNYGNVKANSACHFLVKNCGANTIT